MRYGVGGELSVAMALASFNRLSSSLSSAIDDLPASE
jgi:hypothetical protein